MAAKGSVSKHKDPNQRVRMLDGEPVRPVLYNGRGIGHGKYFTGEVKGQVICNDKGVPMYLRDIGDLVKVG